MAKPFLLGLPMKRSTRSMRTKTQSESGECSFYVFTCLHVYMFTLNRIALLCYIAWTYRDLVSYLLINATLIIT